LESLRGSGFNKTECPAYSISNYHDIARPFFSVMERSLNLQGPEAREVFEDTRENIPKKNVHKTLDKWKQDCILWLGEHRENTDSLEEKRKG